MNNKLVHNQGVSICIHIIILITIGTANVIEISMIPIITTVVMVILTVMIIILIPIDAGNNLTKSGATALSSVAYLTTLLNY
jgi:hypothetical protein